MTCYPACRRHCTHLLIEAPWLFLPLVMSGFVRDHGGCRAGGWSTRRPRVETTDGSRVTKDVLGDDDEDERENSKAGIDARSDGGRRQDGRAGKVDG